MSGRTARSGRRPSVQVSPPEKGRFEAVIRALPMGEREIGSTELIKRLKKEAGSRASAIRWLKEAQRRRIVDCRKEGRRRFYSFAMTGVMDEARARDFLRGLPFTFLREGPKLAPAYQESLEAMTLFWEQASTALVLSIKQLIASAQSVSSAQIDNRVMPSVNVARRQVDVLTEAFVKPWVSDLVATLHTFLETERRKNRTIPRRPDGQSRAPSSIAAYEKGWKWAEGPRGVAHELWISRKRSGPWGQFLEQKQRELEDGLRRISAESESPLTPPSDTT